MRTSIIIILLCICMQVKLFKNTFANSIRPVLALQHTTQRETRAARTEKTETGKERERESQEEKRALSELSGGYRLTKTTLTMVNRPPRELGQQLQSWRMSPLALPLPPEERAQPGWMRLHCAPTLTPPLGAAVTVKTFSSFYY